MGSRIALTAYPMPAGARKLMPYQDMPFNGDGYAAHEVLRLKAKHGLTAAVETGTCYGSTTLFLWEHFRHVNTTEIHRPTFDIAVDRMCQQVGVYVANDIGTSSVWIGGHGHEGQPNSIKANLGSSPDVIQRHGPAWAHSIEGGDRFLFFLDAHWGNVCPLHAELDAIAQAGIRPVLMIHDWQVPDRPDLGHDYFPDGRPFSLENITAALDLIYGRDGWEHHYNDEAEGARRGILYVEPKASTPA
jgi:hypothetical protein